MLKIDNIQKTFKIDNNPANDKHALKGVSLEINDGDFVTVIGGNGSGKTTLLNSIAGSVIVDSGSITLNRINLTKMREHKRAKYIGRVFQDPMLGTVADMSLVQNMSLAENRGKFPSLKWAQSKEISARYQELLKPLGLDLENRLETQMRAFSGGQRQSVTLLMATLNTPQILLLDEHTAALDPKTANKVMQLTNEIVTNKKITTLMITHNMKDAIKYGNRLIMMSEGKIIFEASGKEKEKLTVEDLLLKFNKLGNDELPDSIILG